VEQDAPPAALYDFLYRDKGRLTSYYSQIFEGHLTSVEESDSDRETVSRAVGANVQIVKGDLSKGEESGSAVKRTIDPHDLITTDVLTALREDSFLRTDIQTAPHGSLVQAQGTIVFADRHILEMASTVFKSLMEAEKAKPRHLQDKAALSSYGMIDGLMRTIPLPSAFVLDTTEGVQVAGTIKDEGMEEPISTYYFRHGVHGLAGVYMIGIKEVPSETVTLPVTPFLEAAKQTAQGLTVLLIPPDAIRVTPLAFFRKLEPVPRQR
jgi:hypothetical protein